MLQEGEYTTVGGRTPIRANVRIIAATHRDLPRLVRSEAFRSDLYYRLRVFEIHLPPLRERGDDILELARHLLGRAASRLGKTNLALVPAAEEAILAHHWPGNVRELANALERAVILCDTGRVTTELLALEDEYHEVRVEAAVLAAPPTELSPRPGDSLEEYFRRFVLEHQERLSETELARRLGISRKALWERRARLGIPRRGALS